MQTLTNIDDTIDLVDNYIYQNDWRVKENSNMGYSLQGLNNYISSAIIADYWLDKIYSKELSYLHKDGWIHIHDLNSLSAYCVGWDMRDLLVKGFNGVPGKTRSAPAKHLRVALLQAVNFIYTLQGETSGANAFSNFDSYLAPFIRYDGLSYKQVKQAMQEFLFNINVPTRVGFQNPFSNATMDLQVNDIIKNDPIIIGGEIQNASYEEFQEEMDLFNKAFAEVMYSGDASGRVFSFPIPTYNITKDFDWDYNVNTYIWKIAAKFGIPYFSNFVNSDMKPSDARSMCPLTPDTKVMVRTKQNDVRVAPIIDIINNMQTKKTYYEVWTPEGWRKAKYVRVPKTDVYEIILSNGAKVRMGENHLQPVRNGKVLKAKDLRVGMWLPFNKEPIISSMGKKYMITGVDNRNNRLSKNPVYRIDYPERKFYGDYFAEDEKYNYYKIVKITKIDYRGAYLYCFEVENDEHLFMLANGLITHNCRLRLDTNMLRKRGGGLFGANPLTGSIGVCTLNLPRVGIVSKNEDEVFHSINYLIDKASEGLEKKREVIEKFTDMGMYPYTRYYLGSIKEATGKYWSNHFSTIGIIGMNEMLLNLGIGHIFEKEGRKFGLKVMDFIRDKILQVQDDTNNLYNFEATPAEGATYRLAMKNHKKYGYGYYGNGTSNGEKFYTNSSQLPVWYDVDIFDALEHQDEFQIKYTGGTVHHIFMNEKPDVVQVKNLVKKITSNFRLPYFTLTPTFSICSVHGYLNGVQERCPKCGAEAEVYSRVVGYLRPVKQWNDGKKREFDLRTTYNI